jgi:hypothetical protein
MDPGDRVEFLNDKQPDGNAYDDHLLYLNRNDHGHRLQQGQFSMCNR